MNSLSTKIPFIKMQSLGNDFVLFEKKHLKMPLTISQIRNIADRRQGIGCDQVIVIQDSSQADAAVSFFNADGSVALACGNGTRCVAKYLGKESGIIQTPSFFSQFWKRDNNIAISLKDPTFLTHHSQGHGVDIGNPHVVIFTEDLNSVSLESLALSLQPTEGINVEIAQIISPTTIKAKVWERGVGITPACGSGACAVGILSLKLGLIQSPPVQIEMDGGALTVEWIEGTAPLLIGPASYCFEGIIDFL